MLRLSWSTFRERWQLFAGAIITVCLGVALVQSSLLVLLAAAVPDVPAGLSEADEAALRDGYVAAVSLLAMVLGVAAFVAVFIVASTFAFTVAQRRRDLALFRLTGASRRQVRVLLTGEALLLGAVGTALGVVLGLPVMRFEGWLLVHLDFVPPGFTVAWRPWIIAVSAGTGLGVAVLGVLGASRRASRVRPLEALRETGPAGRVMTAPRWVTGTIFLAGGAAMLILTSVVDGDAAVPLALNACIVLVAAFGALAPLVVPLVGGVLGGLVRVLGGPTGLLAHANLRDGVRRSAATAAPIMVLVGLVAGLGGTLGTITVASRQEMERTVDADLVVTAAPGQATRLSTMDGVRTVSAQAPVSFKLLSDDSELVDGIAVDPAAYARTHRIRQISGDLGQLRGKAIAVTRGYGMPGLGATARVRVGSEEMDLRVVAVLPATLSNTQFLLPLGLLPADGPARYVVKVDRAADAGAVAERIRAARLGDVSTVAGWIRGEVREQQRTSLNVMIALLGMAMVYTIIAMVNAVVVAAADRGPEFAAFRLTGMSRAQVVWAALWESLAVVAVGVLLGGLAAAGTLVGLAWAISRMTGLTVVAVPWQLFGALTVGAAAVVGVTSILTTRAATRRLAIRGAAT
ncbi:MAG: ABC transporter permease [Micromonosporaceae bacterium]|nr:ABC transporter permease [Micromonosporaceae bacterium]